MNYKYLKTGVLFITAAMMLLISGCLKKAATYTDFSSLQDFVVLTAGTGGSSSVNVAYNRADTVRQTITADLASASNPSSSITVTIAYDPAKIATFNSANGTSYVPLPAANFKLVSTTLTIPAGGHYAQTTLQITTAGLDPATSYMTPISITDASGKALSANANTLYFYTIGNPLAGTYNWLGQRWNSPALDTTTAPASTPYNNVSVSVAPLNSTTLFMNETYLYQNLGPDVAGFALAFTNTAGTLSNFSVSIYDPQGAVAAVGFSFVTAPVLVGYKIVGTSATKYVGSVFRFYTSVNNGAGGIRATINTYTKTQ